MAIKNPGPYRDIQRPYTRTSKVRSKAYIKTVPPQAIVKFVMGSTKKWIANEFPFRVDIRSEVDCQIRDVALEAARQQILRATESSLGTDFYFNVAVAPHHILREHKQAAVAQADRMSQGMALSFGRTAGRAAQVHKGKSIFILGLPTEDAVVKLRAVYNKTKQKLPVVTRFEVIKVKQP